MIAPAAHLAQAAVLMDAGKIEEAQQFLLRHIRGKPHPHTYFLLSIAHETLGQLDQALYFAQRAVAADPADPVLVAGEAQRLFTMGRNEESLARLEGFSARSSDSNILSARISMLAKLDREQDALMLAESLPAAIRDQPVMIDAVAGVLTKLGRLDEAHVLTTRGQRVFGPVHALLAADRIREAADVLQTICERFPDDESAWTFYASILNYLEGASRAEILRAHTRYAPAVRKRLGPAHTSWNVTPDPDRPLRVGIVSPDLRRHAIVSFLAPLLENYDKSAWHVTAYSVHHKQDEVSARLRTLVDAWRWLPTSHTALLLRRIRDDRIDVLIELSGHTEMHKLDAMHMKAAPVQATYLGYPNTTGLDTIDIRLVDSITDPPGAEQWATERLVRIDPCFLCFKPIDNAPALAPPPMLAKRSVSFGSFNLPKKISPGTLSMWGRLLAAVPGSSLVLKHVMLQQQWRRDQLRDCLADAGIDPARITILPPPPGYVDHLAAYSQIDVALDTYPYHGTTTTCEAMWMGVPVVTLCGDRHVARVGCSLLSAIGLSDLIADSPDEFVAVGSRLAADPARLAAWRTPGPGSLRDRMAESPLCDAPAFAARFQSAIRDAWRSWCATRSVRAGANIAQ